MSAAVKAHHETIQIADGHMCKLTGFGQLPFILQPQQSRSVRDGSIVQTPARPTMIGNLALVELDGKPFVFVENNRQIWHDLQRRPLLLDEDKAMKRFAPRVVTIRVLAHERPLAESKALPIFLAIDEALGRPILAIGGTVYRNLRQPGPQTQMRIGVEWHPDGYDPPWLREVV